MDNWLSSFIHSADLDFLHFFLSALLITLCAYNSLSTGRVHEGLAPLLYRVAFVFLAVVTAGTYILLYDSGQPPPVCRLILLLAINLLLVARINAIRADDRDKKISPDDRCAQSGIKRWLSH